MERLLPFSLQLSHVWQERESTAHLGYSRYFAMTNLRGHLKVLEAESSLITCELYWSTDSISKQVLTIFPLVTGSSFLTGGCGSGFPEGAHALWETRQLLCPAAQGAAEEERFAGPEPGCCRDETHHPRGHLLLVGRHLQLQ